MNSPDEAQVDGLDIVLPALKPEGTHVVLTLVDQREGEPGGVRVYYGITPVDEKTTITDFLATGGLLLNEHQPDGRDAAAVVEAVGQRAIPVAVGTFPAVLVHGDELKKGFRPYSLYWSDGSREFSVLAGVEDSAALIDFARSIYCG